MSSIIKSPFINYASNNKKLIRVNKDDPNIIGQGSSTKKVYDNHINEIIKEEKAKANLVANDVINKALGEAECIVQDAKNTALSMGQEAHNKALEDGYRDGFGKGEEEALLIKQEALSILEDAKKQKEQMLRDIEPKIALIITNLVQKLTNYVIDKEQIIIYLIRKGFGEIEILDNVIVHVSVSDFDFVVENKSMLSENISEKVNIEILKDLNLDPNDCIIETKSGNIDCSLSTQLSGLTSDLQLIANSIKS